MEVVEGQHQVGDEHPGTSPLEESLRLLNDRIEWVPFGWQRLYADMRLMLIAVNTAGRAKDSVYGGYEEDGLLYVDSCSVDPVIQGVLRKARARAKNTCTWCGGRGARQRLIGEQTRTLCAQCAGHLLLYEELSDQLSRLDRPARGDLEQSGVRVWTAIQAAWPTSTAKIEEVKSELNMYALKAWMERLWARLHQICSGH